MLNTLAAVEEDLPRLLLDEAAWTGLFIDYHPPTVERLWLPWRDCRVYLHRIHPCAPGEALFHPHPWPSAMRILAGEYEMAVGYGQGEAPPPVAALIIATGDFRYEMTDPDAWHYVRPLGRPTLSLMVTGKPWDRPAPRSRRPLVPLTDQQRDELFRLFRQCYPLSKE
jgi:hypothetical protein